MEAYMAQNEALLNIKNELFSLSDREYAAFQAKLIPNISPENILGVRTPVLRKYAGKICKTEIAEEFLKTLPHAFYDENNLHAFLIERISDYNRLIYELDGFLPFIDNWATCDMLRPKVFTKHRKELCAKIPEWLNSHHTYTVRFGIEVLMLHFLIEDFSPEYPGIIADLESTQYYVNMMRAWYFAEGLARRCDDFLPYFENRVLDSWTHNKAIRKAIESYRITPEQKNYLRKLTVK